MSGARQRPTRRGATVSSLYARLQLCLLPDELLRQHGDAMRATFEALESRARDRGWLAWGALLLREGRDLVRLGLDERRSRRRGDEPARSRFAGWGAELLLDLRQALRAHRRSPLLFLVVVATLAVGIGANAALVSLLHSLWLRPLPVDEPDRLVSPYVLHGEDPFAVSALDLRAWQRLDAFSSLTAARAGSVDLLLDGRPWRVASAEVTPTWFPTLGIEPWLGRAIATEDAAAAASGGAQTVWISHRSWLGRFGGDPGVVGSELVVDGEPRVIAGVLPPRFDLPFAAELWQPLDLDALDADALDARQFLALARLAPGVSRERARAEVHTVAETLARERPDTHAGWTADLIGLRGHLLDDAEERVAPALVALAVAVLLVLLITAANVSNLLLARLTRRRQELRLRAALGADRSRLARQLLSESLLLGTAGGLAGLGLAAALLPAIGWLSPLDALAFGDTLLEPRLEAPVVLVVLGLSIAVGLGLGVLPALRFSSVRPGGAGARSEIGGHRRFMSGTVVAQVALAVLMVSSAVALLQSFQRLQTLSLGFEPQQVLLARVQLPVPEDAAHEARVAMLDRLLERLEAEPGVTSAAATSNAPLDHLSWDARVWPRAGEIAENELVLVADRRVTPGYAETMGMELVAGRFLDRRDRADSEPVAVITEDLARRFWPGERAVGRQLRRGGPDSEQPWRTVVGVVRETKEDRGAFRRSRAAWYVPWAQEESARSMVLALRTEGDPRRLAGRVEAVVEETLPTAPLFGVGALEDQLATLFDEQRFAALLSASFALLGLVLSALGIYGVLAFAVAQQRREIGIRIALGARPRRLLLRTVLQGVMLATLGLALGVTASLATAGPLSRLLFRVDPVQPTTLLALALGAIVVAVLASSIPARRATAVDPTVALRE